MITNLDDITAIRTHFLDIWPAETPVVFDNEAPKDEPDTIWARLSVNPGYQKRSGFPVIRYTQIGRANLQVFVPRGTEDGEGWRLAELYGRAFCELDLDNGRIRFAGVDYRSHDATDDDPFYMIFVSVAYDSTQS